MDISIPGMSNLIDIVSMAPDLYIIQGFNIANCKCVGYPLYSIGFMEQGTVKSAIMKEDGHQHYFVLYFSLTHNVIPHIFCTHQRDSLQNPTINYGRR